MSVRPPKGKFSNRLKFRDTSLVSELNQKKVKDGSAKQEELKPSIKLPTPLLSPGLLTSSIRKDSGLKRRYGSRPNGRDAMRGNDRLSTISEDNREKSFELFGPGMMSLVSPSGAGERGGSSLRMSLTKPSSSISSETPGLLDMARTSTGRKISSMDDAGNLSSSASPGETSANDRRPGRAQTDPLITYQTWAERRQRDAPVLPWVVPITPVQTEWRTDHVSVPWTQGKPFCCIRECDFPCFTGPPLLAGGGGRHKIGMKWLKEKLLKKPPFEVCDCAPTSSCPHWCQGRDDISLRWRKVKPVTSWQLARAEFLRPPAPLPPPALDPLPSGGPVCNVSEAPHHGAGPLPYGDTRFACRRAHPRKTKSPPSPALDKSQKGMLWTPTTAALRQELEPFQSMEAPQWMRRPYINVVGAVKDAGWQGESPKVAAREAIHKLLGSVVVKGDDETKKRVQCTVCRPKRSSKDARQVWKSVCARHQPDYCCGVEVTDWLQDVKMEGEERRSKEKEHEDKAEEEWVRNELLGNLFGKGGTR